MSDTARNGARTAPSDYWQNRLWRDLAYEPRRSLAVACLVAVVIAVLTGILATRGATTYTSQAAMLIDDPYSLATAADEGQIIKLSDLRFKYASLATTEVIAAPVASELNVPVGVVEGSVSVTAPANSLLMYVSARWDDPGFAQQLATSEAEEISSYIQQEEATYNVPQADRYRAVLVSPAGPAARNGPSRSHAAVIAFAAFAGALVVVFVLSQLAWEPRLRRRN